MWQDHSLLRKILAARRLWGSGIVKAANGGQNGIIKLIFLLCVFVRMRNRWECYGWDCGHRFHRAVSILFIGLFLAKLGHHHGAVFGAGNFGGRCC